MRRSRVLAIISKLPSSVITYSSTPPHRVCSNRSPRDPVLHSGMMISLSQLFPDPLPPRVKDVSPPSPSSPQLSPELVSLRPRFSKDQPWKDLNRKKQRRGPDTSQKKSKRSTPSKKGGVEDYYQTMFSKSDSKSSFQDLHIVRPLEDDVWGQSSNTLNDSGPASKKKTNELFSLSEPTSKAKQEGLKLEQHLKENLMESQSHELILPEAFKALSISTIDNVVKSLGLHWQMYGTKGKELKLVSKYPLARYRPEFDPRTKLRHRIHLDDDILGVVKLTLNTHRFAKDQHEEELNTSNFSLFYLTLFSHSFLFI